MHAPCLFAFLLFLHTQTPPADKPRPPRFTHAVRSPEVQKDGRVTFRFRAPGASKVTLAREGVPRVPMTKDEKGVWSLTTDPLPPDFYVYFFIVDGVVLADPCNPLVKAKVMGGHESIVHVPGPASLSWEAGDVPHGTVHKHLYHSKAVGEERELWVYTPPGYDPAGAKRYPVLYLLHGVGDEATAWLTAGRANVILDNLLARGQAQPMLVVMPLGYGFPNVPDRVGEIFQPGINHPKIMEVFTTMLHDEILPLVERTFRVRTDRESRAVAGLSMGGAQAFYLGLKHRDRFGYVGSFSGAFVMFGGLFDQWFPNLQPAPAPQLLWVSCGKDDFLMPINRRCKDWLQGKGMPHTFHEMPGAHTWTVWKLNLAEFAPLLFQGKKE